MKLRRTSRRLLSALAAVAVGIVGVLVVGTPAQAHYSTIKGEAVCDTTNGEWVVTWTVKSNYPVNSDYWWLRDVEAKHGVGFSSVVGNTSFEEGPDHKVPVDEDIVGTQVVPADQQWALLKVKAKWDDGVKEHHWRYGKVFFYGECEQDMPSPGASFENNCDGTVDVTLANTGQASATFQINGAGDHIVPAGESVVVLGVQPVSGKVVVTSGQEEFEHPWTAPEECDPVQVGGKSDCTSLTVVLTNPQGGLATTYKVVVGGEEKAGDLPFNTVKEIGPFTATAGTEATVTIGNADPVTVKWEPDPEECATPTTTTTTTAALPDTGTGGLTGIIAAGVALVLGGAGLLTMLFLRRRRLSAES